jgi:hypothetical protein
MYINAINGHYFHDDPEKAKELNRYLSGSMIFVRQEFLNVLVEATRVIEVDPQWPVSSVLHDGS